MRDDGDRDDYSVAHVDIKEASRHRGRRTGLLRSIPEQIVTMPSTLILGGARHG